DIIVSAQFIGPDDSVLILDDFLAFGNAVNGLIKICGQAGAKIAGIGACIEKGFQQGGDELRKMGYDVQSLAIIEKMSHDGSIVFRAD
ncbi:MAG: xanthine phosphoribosyltransferase, partial [Oscillospiraceae bacterium]|nr:xanthine phosphoribosyltransferase [Oscillospiraceae bacterium]